MDIVFDKPLAKNAASILRDAGYIPLFDRLSGKQSFSHKIRGDRYPRFHVYVLEENEARLKINLHLDNKEHGWGERRHDSVYDGDDVAEEAARLKRWLEHHVRPAASGEERGKKNFWQKFFGN